MHWAVALALLAGAPLTASPDAPAQDAGLLDTRRSPHVRFHMLPLGSVRWTAGFWKERFEVCRETMIPNMWALLRDETRCHAWANFRIAAGIGEGRDGEHHGPSWHDGDFYKWLEAVASVHAVTEDPALDRLMDDVISVLGKAQRDDGYLHTPTLIDQLRGEPGAREFRDRLDFETYNLGHLMTAACVHHRATGKESLLEIAKAACDYLCRFYERSTPQLARNAICPSHYMGVVELYRTTREPRYLKLARELIEIRDLVEDGTDQNQDRVPFRKMTRAVGHAVRANYLYAGVADVFAETGDATLLSTLEVLWRDVASRKLYVTGGTGALYDGASPYGSEAHRSIQLVHQAYGRPYQLPNVTAYNESCAIVGSLLWNWRMLQATGEAKYADLFERTLYNGALATVSLDGKRFFYVNPLRKVKDLPFALRWSRRRQPYISCFCCPPNTVRTVAETPNYAYGVSERTLWVHLYGASRIETTLEGGERLVLEQRTDYPWGGEVELELVEAPPGPWTLRLRIPGWADEATLSVSGEDKEESAHPGGYHSLTRSWKDGAAVSLELPLRARKLEANPLVEEARNQVALMRGPVVYCLESGDIEREVPLERLALPADATLVPREETLAGARLVALEGEGMDLGGERWKPGELYREARATSPEKVPVSFIPYYAWGNRGDGEMSVWIPVR